MEKQAAHLFSEKLLLVILPIQCTWRLKLSAELLFSAVVYAEWLCNSIKFSALTWKLLVLFTVDVSCRVTVPDAVRCPSCSVNSQPRELIQLKNNPFPALDFGWITSKLSLPFGLTNICVASLQE